MSILEVDDIDTSYGNAQILTNVSLHIDSDEVVSLLGRNGVGKTTTLRSIMGLTPPQRGTIRFKGEDITGLEPHRIAATGIGYAPQTRDMFPELSVMENLRMGAGTSEISEDQLDLVFDLFPRLDERRAQHAGTLSGGEQQMVAIGRALVRDPDLVILDEPTEGLMPALIPEIADVVEEIAAVGYSIFLVEQNVDFATDIADRVYFMDNGRIEDEATGQELTTDDTLIEKYLGVH